ncbi:hypothetical protein LCGC14_1582030 [marine sediment metagenome]|uniref:Uncharacterized protein n=1 Tax=marine sediment metagenome TaxID=412755 RepID=A0A0F9IGT6_9ZZZZ
MAKKKKESRKKVTTRRKVKKYPPSKTMQRANNYYPEVLRKEKQGRREELRTMITGIFTILKVEKHRGKKHFMALLGIDEQNELYMAKDELVRLIDMYTDTKESQRLSGKAHSKDGGLGQKW